MGTISKRARAGRKRAGGFSRRRPAARSRARRRRSRSPLAGLLGGVRLPVLEQRQRDVLGLALVALGVFMGFVLYGSGSPAPRGPGGQGVAPARGWLLGAAPVLGP